MQRSLTPTYQKQQNQANDQSESDSSDDEMINIELIQYNQFIFQGFQNLQSKNFEMALENYQQALEHCQKIQDKDRSALIRANIAVIQFHNCEYRKACETLESALLDLKEIQAIKHSEHRQALFLKIYANLAIIYIVLNKYEDSKDMNENAVEIVLKGSSVEVKQELLQEMTWVYYRFQNFQKMGDGYIENMESKYDGGTLACFYSSLALNRELLGDYQLAFRYHQKSLDLWKSMNEIGFIVLTLKHLTYLSQQLKINQGQNYQQQLQEYLSTEDFQGINPEILFKDFEKKIVCAREVPLKFTFFSQYFIKITFSLQKIEEELQKNILQNQSMQKFIMSSRIQNLQEPNILGEPVWRQAVRLRLCNSVKYSTLLLQSQKLNQDQKNGLQLGIQQMKQTIQLMTQDKHPIMEKQLVGMPYIKDSVNNLKASINKLRKFILYMNYIEPFTTLRNFMIQAGRMSLVQRQKATQQKLINQCYKVVNSGDYLMKCNKDSDGRHHKFFKLANDGSLRWASNEKHISNPNKIQYYMCQDINGVVFGKITPVMNKKFNSKLEPFLCVSLILKTRSLDIYFEPDQINKWMIAISWEVKKCNQKAYVLSPGNFLWRKFKFQLIYALQDKLKDMKKSLSFCKALMLFIKLGLKLK